MVCFSTCLTRWVISFRLSFSSITVVVFFVVEIAVRFRGIGVTVFVSGINLNIFSSFSLFFQQATLISVISWFFTMMARWSGSVGISVCALMAHIVYR